MKFKVATPISTLFQKTSPVELEKILSLSDSLEERDRGIACESALPRIYHCELSIVEKWSDEEIEHVASLISAEKIQLVSFHVHSCYEKPRIENGMFVPTGLRMSEEEMLANAQKNISSLRQKIDASVEIAVENNNYFKSGGYETVCEPAFLSTLCVHMPCSLLLDIGHAEISARHMNTTLDQYVGALPLQKVRQIHLSGITRGEVENMDSHDALNDLDWKQFANIGTECPNLEFVTIEYYKEPAILIDMLERLRTYQS